MKRISITISNNSNMLPISVARLLIESGKTIKESNSVINKLTNNESVDLSLLIKDTRDFFNDCEKFGLKVKMQ